MRTDVVRFAAAWGSQMLKISKLTDYGLLAAVYLARKSGEVIAAREIADFYALPLPAISKVLKRLHFGQVIESHRGVGGGYSFQLDAEQMTLGRLLEVLEGPWDLVDCETTSAAGSALCTIRSACPSRSFMSGINQTIKHAFDQLTLGDLVRGATPGGAWLDQTGSFQPVAARGVR
jgi:Rrf2 family protein